MAASTSSTLHDTIRISVTDIKINIYSPFLYSPGGGIAVVPVRSSPSHSVSLISSIARSPLPYAPDLSILLAFHTSLNCPDCVKVKSTVRHELLAEVSDIQSSVAAPVSIVFKKC